MSTAYWCKSTQPHKSHTLPSAPWPHALCDGKPEEAPVSENKNLLAELLDRLYGEALADEQAYQPRFNEEGALVGSNWADAVQALAAMDPQALTDALIQDGPRRAMLHMNPTALAGALIETGLIEVKPTMDPESSRKAQNIINRADEYMTEHRVTESWRVIRELRDTLVRVIDGRKP